MFKQLMFLLIGIVLGIFSQANASNYYAIVHGDQFLLEIYDESHHLVCSYLIGLGKNGLGKTKIGDLKTPLGEYHVLWKASRYYETDGGLPITDTIGYCADGSNDYLTTLQDELKDIPLSRDAYGGPNSVFLMLDYPNSIDQEKGYTGNQIAIHATLCEGIGTYSSAGCIRMSPQDARDLYQYLAPGSKVVIQEN